MTEFSTGPTICFLTQDDREEPASVSSESLQGQEQMRCDLLVSHDLMLEVFDHLW